MLWGIFYCCNFLAWRNLSNVSGPWILAILVICDVIEWILAWILGALKLWKICCIGLVKQIHDVCGKFVGMCKSYFMSMAKFCGYGYGKILWVWKNFLWIWKNFVGPWYGKKFVLAWNFGHWKFLLGMRFFLVILMMSNTCLCWFFRRVEWQWLIPLEDLWRKGSFSYGANFASFCISEIHR